MPLGILIRRETKGLITWRISSRAEISARDKNSPCNQALNCKYHFSANGNWSAVFDKLENPTIFQEQNRMHARPLTKGVRKQSIKKKNKLQFMLLCPIPSLEQLISLLLDWRGCRCWNWVFLQTASGQCLTNIKSWFFFLIAIIFF